MSDPIDYPPTAFDPGFSSKGVLSTDFAQSVHSRHSLYSAHNLANSIHHPPPISYPQSITLNHALKHDDFYTQQQHYQDLDSPHHYSLAHHQTGTPIRIQTHITQHSQQLPFPHPTYVHPSELSPADSAASTGGASYPFSVPSPSPSHYGGPPAYPEPPRFVNVGELEGQLVNTVDDQSWDINQSRRLTDPNPHYAQEEGDQDAEGDDDDLDPDTAIYANGPQYNETASDYQHHNQLSTVALTQAPEEDADEDEREQDDDDDSYEEDDDNDSRDGTFVLRSSSGTRRTRASASQFYNDSGHPQLHHQQQRPSAEIQGRTLRERKRRTDYDYPSSAPSASFFSNDFHQSGSSSTSGYATRPRRSASDPNTSSSYANAGASDGSASPYGSSVGGGGGGGRNKRLRPAAVLSHPVPVPNLTKKSRGRRVPTTDTLASSSSNAAGSSSYSVVGTSGGRYPGRRRGSAAASAGGGAGERGARSTRSYTCPVPACQKMFARGEHLKRHIRSIHTYEKPFVCPHEGCGKGFSRNDNLHQHTRVHNKEGSISKDLLSEY